MKRLVTAVVVLSLFSTQVFADSQAGLAEADLQAQLLQSVRKTETEITRAVEAFKAGNNTGGCKDLRAAVADTGNSLDITDQIIASIKGNKILTDSERSTHLDETVQIRDTFLNQKSRMEAQVTNRCT